MYDLLHSTSGNQTRQQQQHPSHPPKLSAACMFLQTTTGSTARFTPEQNSSGSQSIYARNLGKGCSRACCLAAHAHPKLSACGTGGVISEHSANQSLRRPRGYGVGNGLQGPIGSEGNESHYYTQPGHLLDKRHVHPKSKVKQPHRARSGVPPCLLPMPPVLIHHTAVAVASKTINYRAPLH